MCPTCNRTEPAHTTSTQHGETLTAAAVAAAAAAAAAAPTLRSQTWTLVKTTLDPSFFLRGECPFISIPKGLYCGQGCELQGHGRARESDS